MSQLNQQSGPARRTARRTALAVSLAGILGACGGAPVEVVAPAAPQIPVATPLVRQVADSRQYPARVEAIDRVELRPRVSGYVDSVHFAEGASVAKGDLLFRIDARPYRARLDEAEAAVTLAAADLALAEQEQKRAERLVARQALATQELERRSAALAAATARLASAVAARDLAALELSFTDVIAPIAGRIGRAEVTPGNLVNASDGGGTLLTTVVATDPLYIAFDVDDTMAVAAGRSGEHLFPIRFAAPGIAGDLEGHVSFVDNELGDATGTLRLRATVANPDGRLIPGMLGHVVASLQPQEYSLLIDDKAIGTDQGRRFVLVAGDSGTVEYRSVEVGQLHGGLRVVHAGLEPADRVIVNGLMRVRPGSVVEPFAISMEQAAAGNYSPAAGSMIASLEE